jgi:hypothetical protein
MGAWLVVALTHLPQVRADRLVNPLDDWVASQFPGEIARA